MTYECNRCVAVSEEGTGGDTAEKHDNGGCRFANAGRERSMGGLMLALGIAGLLAARRRR